MVNPSPTSTRLRRIFSINIFTILLFLGVLLFIIVATVYVTQALVEQDAFKVASGIPPAEAKQQYELAKLAAEIRQIRSDTSGSLFWLKMIALFVTVGGAVGGFLMGQRDTAQRRIAAEERQEHERIKFEKRKQIDALYQSMVQELSDQSQLLRAAAAVKLGMLLKSFPPEWTEDDERKEQLTLLTKQVLAASLAIESEKKVLKTVSIALVLHKRWGNNPAEVSKKKFADASYLDLSGAQAENAYWARVDFTGADFFQANLRRASLRESILSDAQFWETNLSEAVLAKAKCEGAVFKLCNLRGANLKGAHLAGASFDGAKVHGAKLDGAQLQDIQEGMVDVSPDGETAQMISVAAWLSSQTPATQAST
jgi:uncharacterized protein YjbI with pentapeptide repeats